MQLPVAVPIQRPRGAGYDECDESGARHARALNREHERTSKPMANDKRNYVDENDEDRDNELLDTRSTLVRRLKGPDTSIFRGWGPKL